MHDKFAVKMFTFHISNCLTAITNITFFTETRAIL